MNIDSKNSDQYVHLFKFLNKKFGNKVNLYPAFIRDYGSGCQTETCYENSIQKAIFLKKIYDEYGIYTKDIYPFRSSKGCMIQQMNSFVIGPEGELYKCWHHLGMADKIIGSIFSPKTITNFSLLSDMMMKGDSLFEKQCTSCVLFPSCYGGCMDDKKRKKDYCIPAKSMLEEFIDIHYISKTQSKISY